MSVYTVYEPPLRAADAGVDPERFVFVRDGFSFWAFVLAPVWILMHRLWLVLVLYLVGAAVVQVGFWFAGASMGIRYAVGILLSLLVGLEAATLWRWTLRRRGWRNIGLVVADDVETAERRFYDAWIRQRGRPSLPPATEAPAAPTPAYASPAVIGLFPEPGGQR
jgi:hypothetical protein